MRLRLRDRLFKGKGGVEVNLCLPRLEKQKNRLKVKENYYFKKEEMNKYKIRMRRGEREKVMRKRL